MDPTPFLTPVRIPGEEGKSSPFGYNPLNQLTLRAHYPASWPATHIPPGQECTPSAETRRRLRKARKKRK